MGFLDTVVDIALGLAGGLGELVQELFGEKPPKSATVSVPATTDIDINNEIRHQIICCKSGEFLLNTRSGRVWRYDQATDQLVLVERRRTHLDDAAYLGILVALQQKLSDAYSTLSATEKEKFEEVTQSMNAAVANKIEELMKNIKVLPLRPLPEPSPVPRMPKAPSKTPKPP